MNNKFDRAIVDLNQMRGELHDGYFEFKGISYLVEQGKVPNKLERNIPYVIDENGKIKTITCVINKVSCSTISNLNLIGRKLNITTNPVY